MSVTEVEDCFSITESSLFPIALLKFTGSVVKSDTRPAFDSASGAVLEVFFAVSLQFLPESSPNYLT